MGAIRFRAWNREQGKYCHNIEQRDDWANFIDGYYDTKLEQSTGITDAYGREIYEGDIVRVSPKFEPDITEVHNGEVVFAIGYGAYMINYHDYDLDGVLLFPTVVDRRVVVIGNIHENEELLNENN